MRQSFFSWPRSVPSAYLLAMVTSAAPLAAGCASSSSEIPEWPRQPSPSYPNPNSEADSSNASDERPTAEPTLDESAAPRAPAEGRSDLAKKYRDATAQRTITGKATYYADSLAGNHTANGDVYDPQAFTGAHKKLPFGTIVRVVRTDTDQETYVRINDRGPFGSADRIIDLSRSAAEELDMMRAGVVPVRVEVVESPDLE